jgi:dipeptidyl aminopeptidase/acylaminoacyl peptidase
MKHSIHLLLLLFLFVSVSAQPKRGLQPEDLFHYKEVADAQIAPDGSPLKHIKNVKTPTMLVHGENDNDVHITQAEEMYTALKMRGVDTVLIRYPREGHGIREPKHRVDNLQRVLDWFEKYLQ